MTARRKSLIVLALLVVVAIAVPIAALEMPLALGGVAVALQGVTLLVVLRVWLSLERSQLKVARTTSEALQSASREREAALGAALQRETSGIRMLVQDVVAAEARAWRSEKSRIEARVDETVALATEMGRTLSDSIDDLVGQVAHEETVRSSAKERQSAEERIFNELADARGAYGEQTKANKRYRDEVFRSVERVRNLVRQRSIDDFKQLESLAALYWDTSPSRSLPPTRSWAASPDLLRYLYDTVAEQRPTLVVECGSGVSTLVMALAMQRHNPGGRIVALEHLEEYAGATARLLEAHGCAVFAEVRHAPLVPVVVNGREYQWYRPDQLPDGPIDVLLVDGPPGSTVEDARFPAMPMLHERLSSHAEVLLDDTNREGEARVLELWLEGYPAFEGELLRHEKGTARLRRRGDDDRGAGSE